MIICITGTPGTGKTKVAGELAKMLGYDAISITELVKAKKIQSTCDRKRKSLVVDEKKLDRAIKKLLDPKKSYIIESHLAHYIRSDMCVVLRTNPAKLELRLAARRWAKDKIMENVQAEILDLAAAEAISQNKNVIEIDTSRKSPQQAARLIVNVLKRHLQKNYRAGRIDWTRKYLRYLTGD